MWNYDFSIGYSIPELTHYKLEGQKEQWLYKERSCRADLENWLNRYDANHKWYVESGWKMFIGRNDCMQLYYQTTGLI